MTSVSFDVPIIGDNILESVEQFQLSISNLLPDRVIVSDPSQTMVTITDNDGKSPNIVILYNIIFIL